MGAGGDYRLALSSTLSSLKQVSADLDRVTGERDRARRLAAVFMDQDRARGHDRSGGLTVHDRDACQGRGCPVHHPSTHHMRAWPLVWRPDRGLMERACPHGVGHPDPDDAAYRATFGDGNGVHGCDGCCQVVAS